jgi:ParB-like chromosome segregation protein Spo0J
MGDKEMKIETFKISELRPAEYNPRQSTKKQEADLQASLSKFGCVEPIIVNVNANRKNVIVGGHFRVRELKKIGIKEIECVVVDLNIKDEKELNVRLNKNTGGWDFDCLANNFELEELIEWGFDDKDLQIDTGLIDDDTQMLRDDLNKKYMIEVTFPNELELADIRDDLLSRGYIVKEK